MLHQNAGRWRSFWAKTLPSTTRASNTATAFLFIPNLSWSHKRRMQIAWMNQLYHGSDADDSVNLGEAAVTPIVDMS